jgi:GAF domain-containing protein
LLRQGTPIGVLLLQRSIVQPFTDKEIALAETFADQAVIAIENVRLFEAEQLRTRELTESLEHQTATSEVLRVISSSQGELQPVFDTMLANATRVCEAQFGHLLIPEGDAFRNMAICDAPSALAEKIRGQLFRPHPESPLAQAGTTKQPVRVHDLLASRPYLAGNPAIVMLANLGGARTLAAVPMLNESELVGVIILYRNAVRPFTDKQIELVQNFAAQAVIAIENARLLSELRQRTDALTERTAELTESLEQQTATSEVLQVISSSPGDLEPVFETMLQNAVRICDAKFGGIYRIEDNAIRLVATHADVPAAYAGARRFAPFRPSPKHYFGRMMAARTVVHIADAAAEQGYVERRSEYVAAIELGGVRTFMAVPMLKENEPIGAFLLARQEVRPFTDKQIALVTNFAAQAVIAIENTRLLTELRESLQQQTATADVLRVISNSPTNIQPVLDAIVQTAGELCASEYAIFFRLQDGKYHVAASNNTAAEYVKYLTEHPISIDRGSLVGRTALERRSVHIPDCLADPEYTGHEYARVGKHRSMLGVPLLRDGAPIGVIGLLRTSVRPYTEKQIELVTTFAD